MIQTNLRAAVYCRYSSDNQTYSSIEAQLFAIEQYCKNNNIIIVERYRGKIVYFYDKSFEFGLLYTKELLKKIRKKIKKEQRIIHHKKRKKKKIKK